MSESFLVDFSRPEIIKVSDVGQIGAGPTVEFLPSVRKRNITRPKNTKSSDELISARVAGDSMIDDGIFDGDRVTCRTNFELSEVRNGRLVIVRIPDGGLVLKKFYLTADGMVRLVSANPAYKDLCYELHEVEIKAIVLESIRSWD